ncbi:hypothetical protein HPP92_014651 [Vanilla planifolia]|uniref:Pectinesterase inhibitor domain-containing protein n=1 Tax=Vanilla planifolia TaxID=51239 RepID=A0A835URB0_VANPL|nr:hypothetical protein HPP92_014651 [Vanilla planifolia]
MQSTTSLLRSLLLILFLASTSAASSSIDETCRSISASRPDIPTDFCVSTLTADPAAASSDHRGLALIATRLSATNATRTVARIQQLIDERDRQSTNSECLRVCLEVYSDAEDHLQDAAASVEAGKYRDAITLLSAALDSAENCEDAFGDEGISPSPMVAEDGSYEKLVELALAIVATLP